MRQQYLIWNKESVTEETIFKDIERLSEGKLIVPEHIHLESISDKEKFNRPGLMLPGMQPRNQFKKQGRNKNKKWKKQ